MNRYVQTIFFFLFLAVLTIAAAVVPIKNLALDVSNTESTSTPTPKPITSTVIAHNPAFEKIFNLGVPVGNSTAPQRIALNSNAGKVYIFSSGVPVLKQGNSIAVFDIETGEFTALTRINQGAPRPLDLQFDAPTRRLFALWDPDYTSNLPRTLSVVDAETLNVVQEIPEIKTFAVGDGLLYTADENTLAVWSSKADTFRKQKEINLTPALGRGPMAVNTTANRVYTTRFTDQAITLEIFSADTLMPLNTYLPDGPILNILPNPSSGELFLVEVVNDIRVLQRLSMDGQPIGSPFELGPRRGDGIALSSEGETLYYTNGELRPYEPSPDDDTGPAFIGLHTTDLSLQHDIPLPTNFDALVVDPQTNQAFATYPYDNLLYVINLDTDTAQTVYTAANIRDLLVDEENDQTYLLVSGHRVRRLDGETFDTIAETRLDEIYKDGPIGQWTGELALDKERNRLYVSGQPAFVLEADSLDLIEILLPGGQFAPDLYGDKVYFSNCGVTILDADTLTGDTLLPGSGPRNDQLLPNPCASHSRLDSANQLLYSLVPNGTPGSNGGNYLYVYDLTEPTLIFTDTNINIVQALPNPAYSQASIGHTRHTFRQLRTLAVSPTESISYSHQLVSIGGQTDHSPDTNRLYISDNHRLLSLDADTLNVVGEMPLPPSYDYQVMALNPANERVYLAGYDGQLLIADGMVGASRHENLAAMQAAGIITPTRYTPTGKILQLESTSNEHLVARIDTEQDGSRLFLSTDEGTTWHDTNQNLPPFMAQSLAVSPQYAEDQTLFAGLNFLGNTGGIYKSTDSGQTWQAAITGLRDLWTSRLFVSPNFGAESQLIFADTAYTGLHASSDGGQTWTPLVQPNANAASFSSGEGAVTVNSDQVILASQILGDMEGVFRTTVAPNNKLSDWRQVLDTHLSLLAFAPDDETVLGFGTTVWRSTDSGLTWEPGGAGLTDLDRFEANRFLFSPSFVDDQTVYLFFTDIRGEESGRLHRSTDGGQTWQLWESSPDNKIVTAVTLAVDGDFLFGDSQTQITRISPDALTWAESETQTAPFPIDDLAVSPNYKRDQTLFAVSRAQGLFKSTDGGQSWQLTNFPVRSTSFDGYRLAISPDFAHDETLYIATGFSLHRSTDGGKTWQHLPRKGLNFPVEVVAISPRNNTLLISTPTTIFRSSNHGQSWQEVLPKLEEAGPAQIFTFTPSGDTVYVWFDYHDTLYVSSDSGQSWQAQPNQFDDYLAVATGIAGLDESLIVATEFPPQLLQISNLGNDWQPLTDTLPDGLQNVKTMAYGVDEDLLIGGQSGAFISSNNGQRWQSLDLDSGVQLIRTMGDDTFVVLRGGNTLTSTDGKTWFDVSPNP
jgi:photosystem II stability/assembly factor-like uncharacterized protein